MSKSTLKRLFFDILWIACLVCAVILAILIVLYLVRFVSMLSLAIYFLFSSVPLPYTIVAALFAIGIHFVGKSVGKPMGESLGRYILKKFWNK